PRKNLLMRGGRFLSSWEWPWRRPLVAALCLVGALLCGPRSLTAAPALGAPAPPAPGPARAKELAVDLETVLRLTEQNNLRIALARERLEESLAAYPAACRSCVPDLLRPQAHRCITTEANVWRQRAEFSQVTHDTLQEAGSTYLDWLTVRQQEAVARQLARDLRPLLARTERLRQNEPGVGHLVE